MRKNSLLRLETPPIHMEEKTLQLVRTKEELRIALNEAGFPIPEGLYLEEWLPIIKEVTAHDRRATAD